MSKPAHITVGGEPFCGWLGTGAGMNIAQAAARTMGVHPSAVTCGHHSTAQAARTAQALRPSFKRGAVAVVAGPCPADASA